jgi:hypothetical protein
MLLRKETGSTRIQTPAVGKKARPAAAERSPPQAVGGRGQARGTRPQHGLGKPKRLDPIRGRASPAPPRQGGISTRWHARRDRRGFSPPVATDYRRPATPARTTRTRRSDRPRSGLRPRRIAVEQRHSTRHSRSDALVSSARSSARSNTGAFRSLNAHEGVSNTSPVPVPRESVRR